MSHESAWVMQIDRVSRVAVGQPELIHIVASPDYIEVPKAPKYCKRIIIWNNKVIPVIDLSVLLNNSSSYIQNNAVAIAIYYDEVNKQIKYGGIQLSDVPVLDKVSNDQAVIKSKLNSRWQSLAVSCYKDKDDKLIPILDLENLFSTGVDKVVCH